MENSEDITIMVQIKEKLDALLHIPHSPEYKQIVEHVDNYIKKNCKHKIITDSIDIDPDTSKTIYYCEKCYQTYDSMPSMPSTAK